MVGGRSEAVTDTPAVSQCADTQRMARGLGSRRATSPQPRRNALSSIAFIGEPCPTNSAGILADRSASLMRPRSAATLLRCLPIQHERQLGPEIDDLTSGLPVEAHGHDMLRGGTKRDDARRPARPQRI